MILSIEAGKSFGKVQNPFMIKMLNKMDIEGMCLNILNAMPGRLTDCITINGAMVNTFLLRSGARQRC